MRFSVATTLAAGLLLVAVPCFARVRPHHSSSTHASLRHTSLRGRKAARVAVSHHEAPAGMGTDRATEIQSALIKQGYLSGTPSGRWDSDSVAAMQKLQGDNGWQTKITPDSRALIKLGLGPQPQN